MLIVWLAITELLFSTHDTQLVYFMVLYLYKL